MKLAQYFAPGERPVISFEIFPPKTDKAMAQLLEVMPRLIALEPSFLTVTYGALGSTQARTLEIATLLKRQFGYEAASHLTCVGSSRQEIDAILDRLTAEGIENI